jgi:hypothetical protein
MVRFRFRPLETQELTQADNTEQKMEIPRDAYIRRIFMRLYMQVNSGSAVSLNEDNPMSLIKTVRLEDGYGFQYLNCKFAYLHYLNCFDSEEVQPRKKTPSTASQTNQSAYAFAVFDTRVNPQDPNDISALIPAEELSSLNLFVNWGAEADLDSGSGFNINWAKLQVVIEEVLLTQQEKASLFGSRLERLLKPKISEDVKTIDASYSDLKFQYNLPMGAWLKRSALITILNGVRSNALISKYQIKQEKPEGIELATYTWDIAQMINKHEYNLADPIESDQITLAGFVLEDYKDITKILTGLATHGLDLGSITIRANTSTPTGTTQLRVINHEFH